MAGDKKLRPFTDKEELFINEYLRCLNGAEAARRAGYSKDSARNIASENLAKPYISEEIERRRSQLIKEIKVDHLRIIRESALIAFARPKKYSSWKDNKMKVFDSADLEMDDDAAIKKITKTKTAHSEELSIEFHSKDASLDRLTKILGVGDGPGEPDSEHDEQRIRGAIGKVKP